MQSHYAKFHKMHGRHWLKIIKKVKWTCKISIVMPIQLVIQDVIQLFFEN